MSAVIIFYSAITDLIPVTSKFHDRQWISSIRISDFILRTEDKKETRD